nr:TPA_asm: E1 [Manis javanica papillomavirus 1]
MDKKGTVPNPEEGCSDWYLVEEAECDDMDDSFEKLFDRSEDSDLSDLIDNSSVDQGNPLPLFTQQEHNESERQIQALKRKFYQSPDKTVDLSPRLQSLTISPDSDRVKKRLFVPPNDSGIDIEIENEAEDTVEELQVEIVTAGNLLDELFKSRNRRAFLLAKFKEAYVCSFNDITRPFKSDKSCVSDWVVFAYGMYECFYESGKEILSKQCDFLHMKMFQLQKANACLFLLRFKAQKCRETVQKLFTSTLGVAIEQLLIEPPNVRKVAAALFWYKAAMGNTSYITGETPEWILRHTVVSKELEEDKFDLSMMIQWAYDNEYLEESQIAYEYAKLAEECGNAAAFLKSNSQAKFVKDCACMVKHYKRAEMRNMSFAEWVDYKIRNISEDGDWKQIVKFIRYQNIPFIQFIISLRDFFKGIPKRNCLVFYGPPNTGKSMFCMSLLNVLKGKVINYTNRSSHFWLQPLADAKIGLLDDATYSCWQYMDDYMRNLLDGNPMSIDCKHKAPVQIKCPPLMITTNVDVLSDSTLKYLHSRLTVYQMNLEFPFPDGKPAFLLTDANWKSFFKRFWNQLEFTLEEEGNDAETTRPFRCGSRPASDIV